MSKKKELYSPSSSPIEAATTGEENCQKKIKLLHWATQDNDLVEMERLLKNGHSAYINERDDFMNTPLKYAWTYEAAELLLAYGADVNAKDRYGHTPLYTAYMRGEIGMAKIYLKNGANFTETKQIADLPSDLTVEEFLCIMLFGDRKPPF